MTSARTRLATPDDVPFLVDLRAEMFGAMGQDVSGTDWRYAAAAWFERAVAAPDLVRVVVACDAEDRPVACAVVQLRDEAPSPSNPDGGSALVHTVCVLPAWRGRGLGRACVEAVVGWVQGQPVGRVELFATPEAEPIYAAAGFARTRYPAMRLALDPDRELVDDGDDDTDGDTDDDADHRADDGAAAHDDGVGGGAATHRGDRFDPA